MKIPNQARLCFNLRLWLSLKLCSA